jgi:hypothetical protein
MPPARFSGAIVVNQAGFAALEAAGMVLRIAPAVLAVILIGGFAAGFLLLRARALGARYIRPATIGAIAAAGVFVLQSGSVGASVGGGVLALAAGTLAVLVVALFHNV